MNLYLEDICEALGKKWPDNKTLNIVCHGHSVPAGYFATPFVNTFESYPHLLHRDLKEKFPFAVINVIVTAIGGENSTSGLARFERDVLNHNPKIVTIDYALNDMSIGVDKAKKNITGMIEKCLLKEIKVILLTPSLDQFYFLNEENRNKLERQAEMIRALSLSFKVALADSLAVMLKHINCDGEISQLLSHVNHPNALGHKMIAAELGKLFLAK